MPLPAAAKGHHTAWVTPPKGTPHPLRYAVDGGRLVCFGDTSLTGVVDGTRVTVAIHEISGGHLLSEFNATLRRLTPDAVSMAALGELLDHVPLGRTLEEVQANLAHHRARRRIVEITT